MDFEEKKFLTRTLRINKSCEYLQFALGANSLVEAVLEAEHINTMLAERGAGLYLFHGAGGHTIHNVGTLLKIWNPTARIPIAVRFTASEIAMDSKEGWVSSKSRSGLRITPATPGLKILVSDGPASATFEPVLPNDINKDFYIPFAPRRDCLYVNVCNPPPSKTYPHKCPKCGNAAYVGFSSVDCPTCGKS